MKFLELKKTKSFKGYNIHYQMIPPLDDLYDYVIEEICYHIDDESEDDVFPAVEHIYSSNMNGDALKNINPEDIQMKFYTPGEFFELKKYVRSY